MEGEAGALVTLALKYKELTHPLAAPSHIHLPQAWQT